MSFSVTSFFYLLIGLGVTAALWTRDTSSGNIRWFRSITAVFFWPLYIPALLAGNSSSTEQRSTLTIKDTNRPLDEMTTLITKVETELNTALKSLDGWAENAFALEQSRIAELQTAWRNQADSIRELDRLLFEPPEKESSTDSASTSNRDLTTNKLLPVERSSEETSAIAQREQSRQENMQKLRRVRRQMYEDLMATLAWVRELVTMIHLAKYTGAPASRAVELVQQIAAAVAGLSNRNRQTT